MQVPCGRCLPCLRRKQNSWAFRIQQEAKDYPESTYFVTLTFSDNNLDFITDNETGEVFGPTLSVDTVQKFFKRLRKNLVNYYKNVPETCEVWQYGKKHLITDYRYRNEKGQIILSSDFHPVRFFLCGEYGDRFQRPHYHAVCFFASNYDEDALKKFLEIAWGKGFVTISPLTVRRSKYVAKYTCKQLFPDEYGKCKPPFALMSRSPAIGSTYVDKNKDFIFNNRQFIVYDEQGTPYPLPRFYKNKIFTPETAQEWRETIERLNWQKEDFEIHKSELEGRSYLAEQRKIDIFNENRENALYGKQQRTFVTRKSNK